MDLSLSKTLIYLLRHGEVQEAYPPRYLGQKDVNLSDEGLRQYRRLINRFENISIDACYTSDLSRCFIGAEIFAEHFHFEVYKERALREIHMGHWQGLTHDEIKEQHSDEWKSRNENLIHYRVGEGESLTDASMRISVFIEKIIKKHAGKQLLLFGHGGINRILLLNAIGTPLDKLENIDQKYCALNIIEYDKDGAGIVKLLNG